jgi:glycosyltransferase involved in cell wall biosynthesis
MVKEKQTIKYSIITPFFNEEKAIKGLLDSVAKLRTSESFELVMVDNSSTDKGPEIVEGYKGKIANLISINESRRGIGVARRTGARASSGDILITTDADVEVPVNYLEMIGDVFDKNPGVIGLVGTYRFLDKSALFNFWFRLSMKIMDHLNVLVIGTYAYRGLVSAMRRDAYFDAGEFNPGISALEDLELSLRMKKLGKIKYVPSIYVDTSYRRFQGRFIRQLIKRTKAYFYRAILRDNKGETDWEVVR